MWNTAVRRNVGTEGDKPICGWQWDSRHWAMGTAGEGEVFTDSFIHFFNKCSPSPSEYTQALLGFREAEGKDGCSRVRPTCSIYNTEQSRGLRERHALVSFWKRSGSSPSLGMERSFPRPCHPWTESISQVHGRFRQGESKSDDRSRRELGNLGEPRGRCKDAEVLRGPTWRVLALS